MQQLNFLYQSRCYNNQQQTKRKFDALRNNITAPSTKRRVTFADSVKQYERTEKRKVYNTTRAYRKRQKMENDVIESKDTTKGSTRSRSVHGHCAVVDPVVTNATQLQPQSHQQLSQLATTALLMPTTSHQEDIMPSEWKLISTTLTDNKYRHSMYMQRNVTISVFNNDDPIFMQRHETPISKKYVLDELGTWNEQ